MLADDRKVLNDVCERERETESRIKFECLPGFALYVTPQRPCLCERFGSRGMEETLDAFLPMLCIHKPSGEGGKREAVHLAGCLYRGGAPSALIFTDHSFYKASHHGLLCCVLIPWMFHGLSSVWKCPERSAWQRKSCIVNQLFHFKHYIFLVSLENVFLMFQAEQRKQTNPQLSLNKYFS